MKLSKRFGLFAAALSMITALSGVSAAFDNEDQARSVILGYYDALRRGDVGTIASHLTGPLFEAKKQLLTGNPEYPGFLREYYRGSTLVVAEVSPVDSDTQIVDTLVFYVGDVDPLKIRFTLVRTGSQWKIASDETLAD